MALTRQDQPDSEKWIEKINRARAEGFLNQSQAQELRKMAKPYDKNSNPTGLASQKGNLGPKDKDKLNALYKKYAGLRVDYEPPKTNKPSPPPPPSSGDDLVLIGPPPIDDVDDPEIPETSSTPPDPPDDVPTVKGKKTTIKIPKSVENRADIPYPDDADPVSMPNIAVKIKKEIDRITMSLVKSTREFLEAGIDFDAVNQVPDTSEFSTGDVLYEDPIFKNQPDPTTEKSVAQEIMYAVSDELNKKFALGDPTNTSTYNYIEYLDLFDLDYKSDGAPVFTLKIEIENAIIEDLEYKILKTDPNGITSVVAEEG